MHRVGFRLHVKPQHLEEYRRHHRSVWPEMLAALREAGWRNYSLFLASDGTLFGYFETTDTFETCLERMETTAVNARWQAMMSPFFEVPDGAAPDRMMVALEEIFHVD